MSAGVFVEKKLCSNLYQSLPEAYLVPKNTLRKEPFQLQDRKAVDGSIHESIFSIPNDPSGYRFPGFTAPMLKATCSVVLFCFKVT